MPFDRVILLTLELYTVLYNNMGDEYKEHAAAAIDALKLAGFYVHYYEHVNVVKVNHEYCNYYINIPKIKKYGALITNKKVVANYGHNISIELTFNHIATYQFTGNTHRVTINGKQYENVPNYVCGELTDDLYLDLTNKWVKDIVVYYDELQSNKMIPITPDQVLDSNFNPVEQTKVKIMNEGLKSVVDITEWGIDVAPSAKFTIINMRYIIDGAFEPSQRNDLFTIRKINFGNGGEPGGKSAAETDEIYALLKYNDTLTLASEREILPVVLTDNHAVRKINGLYDGYEIGGDGLAHVMVYLNEYGDYVDEDEEISDVPIPMIYRYGDIFFSYDVEQEYIIELEARKPNGGSRTKSARITE